MLNIKIIIALLILGANSGKCQDTNDNDRLQIHKNIVKILKKEGGKFNIVSSTRVRILSEINLNLNLRDIDTLSSRISNDRDWIDFIKKTDITSIADYKLPAIKSSGRNAKQDLIFAPIIFSEGKDKALCITKQISIVGGGQMAAWYFVKEKDKWKFKDILIIIIYD